MTGGGGTDMFVLHTGDYAVITDFSAAHSVLDLHGLDPAVISFVQSGADLHVQVSGADLAVLQHVSIADFGGASSAAGAETWAVANHHVAFS